MVVLATRIIRGLTVDESRMAANISSSGGQLFSERVMMALADHIGRQQAHEIVYEISMAAYEEGEHLRSALARDRRVGDVLTGHNLAQLFDLGDLNSAAGMMVDRDCGVADDELRRPRPA